MAALTALAQDSRLAVFRLLVRYGTEGLPAGKVAEILGVPPPTLSFHLTQLSHAGLIQSRREGRQVSYSADSARMNALLQYLTENCCAGGASGHAPQPANPAFFITALKLGRCRTIGAMRWSAADVRFWRDEDLGGLEVRYSSYDTACFSRHTHDSYSVAVVERGRTDAYLVGRNVSVTAGDAVLVHPHEVHSCNPAKGSGWRYWISISARSGSALWRRTWRRATPATRVLTGP